MGQRKNTSNRSKYIRISYTLTSNTPLHPDLKKLRIYPKNQILTGDFYNTSIIEVENHSGTHEIAWASAIPGESASGGTATAPS